MTQTEALARVRQILNETTAGFFADNTIYDYLDSAQNRVIQIGIGYQRGYKLREPYYECFFLKPLISLDASNTTTVGSDYQEYALPAGFIDTYRASYSASNGGTEYSCALLSFSEAVAKSGNTYAQASITKPVYYIKAEKIGFFPQPSGAGANNYAHYYYAQPSTVASGQDFTLREETHEAIIEYALYLAYSQDKNDQLAQLHLKEFQEIINKLL